MKREENMKASLILLLAMLGAAALPAAPAAANSLQYPPAAFQAADASSDAYGWAYYSRRGYHHRWAPYRARGEGGPYTPSRPVQWGRYRDFQDNKRW
jgi:hypothetical protein